LGQAQISLETWRDTGVDGVSAAENVLKDGMCKKKDLKENKERERGKP